METKKTTVTPETKKFLAGVAKSAFEGFMIGSGVTFWTFYILGVVSTNGTKK